MSDKITLNTLKLWLGDMTRAAVREMNAHKDTSKDIWMTKRAVAIALGEVGREVGRVSIKLSSELEELCAIPATKKKAKGKNG